MPRRWQWHSHKYKTGDINVKEKNSKLRFSTWGVEH
jgi:hypothetical protein